MGTYTSRTGKLWKPTAGENVNVTTDINNNMDNLDTYAMGFTQCTNAAARPTTVWPGLCIFQTADSTTWVSNGSSPASASWIQIPNGTSSTVINLSLAATGTDGITSKISSDTTNRFVMNADGGMEWGPGVSSATDTTLRRSAANVLKTDDSFVAAQNISVGGDQSVGGGVGVLGLINATTAPTADPSGGMIAYSVAGQLTTRNPQGLVLRVNGATALSTGSATLATFSAETALATITIPANDMVAGATYRIRAWGTGGMLATATMTFRTRIGGLAGTQLSSGIAPAHASSTTSNRTWTIETYLVCLSTGGTGTVLGQQILHSLMDTTTTSTTTTPTTRIDGNATVTVDTTASQAYVLSVQPSASSASNTIVFRGAIMERVS